MPKSLVKVSKKISNKRKHAGKASAMHEHSRDSKRLQRAAARDTRLSKTLDSRSRQNMPYLERLAHFQDALTTTHSTATTLTLPAMHDLVASCINRDAEELATLHATRRQGRPPSPREQLLEQRVERENKEYDGGFWVPDLEDAGTLDTVRAWDGEWVSCNCMRFVRLARAGEKRDSVWPPNGMS
ncbi:translation machinery-associated protein 16 [Phyllosticta citrichinensis]|uniref:Translation machinery-associated protein 16 n=1 Tax=Phyllosticta citrichinensis TaxID=1130410 RepID=A0ABR1Y1U9_9PEZI